MLVGYAAYQRIGTTANADTIEYLINYAGGFLAIGMTDEQPGFIVLSALDQKHVDVSADQMISLPAGTRTFVEIRTPRQRWVARLRRPQIIIIDHHGTVAGREVGWSWEDFARIRAATDCSEHSANRKHRCGVPFADVQDLVAAGQIVDVPSEVLAFLEQHVKG